MKPLHTILIALTLLLTASAYAQQTADPHQVLKDAAAALQETPGFSAKLTLKGEGSQMILSTLPSLTARLNMGTHTEHNRALHILGELKQTQAAAPKSFDILYTLDKYIWTDHTKKTVNIRPPSVSARQRPTVFGYLLLAEIIKDQPFESQLANADSIELEENQSIAGTDCQVVFITRPTPAAGGRRSSTGSHTHERWFISTEDHLPRRVEHITDAGMIKATLIMELTGLSVAPQSDADLYPFAPENYTISDTTKKPEPTIPDADQSYERPDPNPTNTTTISPPISSDPLAPNYTFTTTTNTTISRATQQARITTLYFFGSWSIPSKHTTPLFAALAEDFKDQSDIQVDTFAIALRESNPSTIIDSHTNNSYAHQLAINPPNTLPKLFQVRIYPTIIVIDDNSHIIFNQHLTKDSAPQQLIDNAKAAITKALK